MRLLDCLDHLQAPWWRLSRPSRSSAVAILKGVGLPYETTSGTTIRPATSCPTVPASSRTCDKWVSDKGPAGRCLGTHPRTQCTNPNRCDAKVEPEQQ